ncbi:MAG: hypothetical protein AMXMBFR64_60100 [Myxococcales bacterium]
MTFPTAGHRVLAAALWALTLWGAAEAREPEMIPEEEPDLIGRTAPEIEAPLLDGGQFRLSEHRGTPTVISFFASWCTPCRHELPALAAMLRARGDVRVVAVNVDKERAAAERFLRSLSGSVEGLPVALDAHAVSLGAYRVLSMPTLFLVDAHGTVKFRRVGFSQTKALSELEAAIEELAR